ncbi:PE family protein [Mycobacterium haemophilum]|uniref:PE family protein n=1 Tax=Mycobacterium haemophilum TaxID=29311 RepID=A0A0I9U4V2_9MYCO|nr:PE-PPE domain-containing protein [Mycobacterium haemophilum]AKN17162.1 PE family protein [Mycobacterium haemophilum DSM 44634]KLO32906.1 PE family protein [Mycobacterium haemophilum]KLO37211.1 PE family protein [Mycobacterium haemophilum]KLO43683.1 PE family protein [Mycobacterium haemophilum]KLO56041.1 PE family protein [Mycobacterium haemophilum]
MSFVTVASDAVETAAEDLSGVVSTIESASTRAAPATTMVLPPAADSVSTRLAALFNEHGQVYQSVSTQAVTLYEEFVDTLSVSGGSYAESEEANVLALQPPLGRAPLSATRVSGRGLTSISTLLAEDEVTALIMGGTMNPLPDAGYVRQINNAFIQTGFPGAVPRGVFTPEQFWPVTPHLGNLTFNRSVAEGVRLLDTAVDTELSSGNPAVVFGYSQSATIAHNYINSLVAVGSPYPDDISFMMVGSPNNPVGGLLSRFPGFHIPFLDVPFNGATSANIPYQTSIYTAQYDGIAHAPQFPLNVLSDINAVMGYFSVHMDYPNLLADQVANAVPLPTSPGYTGNTNYYMFLTQDLPLLQPIRAIPYIGPPIADLLQPQLRVLVDLGYADFGPGGNYADIPTPAGLLAIPDPFAVTYYLIKGGLQAAYGAAVDIGVQAGLIGPEWFPTSYPWVPSINPGLHFYWGQSQVTLLSVLSGLLGQMLYWIPPYVFEWFGFDPVWWTGVQTGQAA